MSSTPGSSTTSSPETRSSRSIVGSFPVPPRSRCGRTSRRGSAPTSGLHARWSSWSLPRPWRPRRRETSTTSWPTHFGTTIPRACRYRSWSRSPPMPSTPPSSGCRRTASRHCGSIPRNGSLIASTGSTSVCRSMPCGSACRSCTTWYAASAADRRSGLCAGLPGRADQSPAPADRMRRQRGDAHRDDRPFSRRQRAHRREELFRTRPIDDAQHGVPARRQPKRLLTTVLLLCPALHEPALDQAVDEPARRRWGAVDRIGKLPDRERAPVGEDVQRRELCKPEPQVAQLARETDEELAPQRTAHGDALADLPHVGQPVAGCEDRRREIRLETPRDRAAGCRSDDLTRRTLDCHCLYSVLGRGR